MATQLDRQVADELVTYAVQHMQAQVGQVAETQAALSQLWQAVLDPADLAGSFTRFTLGAEQLILAARSRGQITAQAFYQESRALAGIVDELPIVAPVEQSVQADLAALYSTGLATAQRQLSKGANVDFALQAAQAAVLRAAQRRILDAPRQRLIDLSEADENATGWARVGDGHPCYFCAMLIGRGPVYTEQTVRFRAHDGCGCSAKPVFKNDPSKGWSADAQALNAAWYRTEPGEPIARNNAHSLSTWRSSYNELIADPTSSVRIAMDDVPRSAYGLAA